MSLLELLLSRTGHQTMDWGRGRENIPDQTAPSVGPSKPSHVFIQFEGHFVWLNDEDKGGKKKKGLLRWI